MAYKTSDFYALLMETSARFIHAREMAGKFEFFFKVRELSGNYVRKECYFAKISGKCHKILHFMLMKFGYLVMM